MADGTGMQVIEGDQTRSVTDEELTQHLKELRAYGYTRLEAFLSPELVRRLLDLVERHYKSTQARYEGRPTRDTRDKIIYNLQNKDRAFIEILDDLVIRRIVMPHLNDPYYRFLPPDAPNYILTYYNARSSGEKLDLHIDSSIPVPGDRTWSMQVAYVLEDHTIENGSTVVVPGSHRAGEYTDRELKHVYPVLAKAGDLVVWDSRLWHGTLANVSSASRWTLIATFAVWWHKQAMDMTRSLPDGIYQELTPAQKALLGFCSIPPKDETERINTKTGYESLRPSVHDYHR